MNGATSVITEEILGGGIAVGPDHKIYTISKAGGFFLNVIQIDPLTGDHTSLGQLLGATDLEVAGDGPILKVGMVRNPSQETVSG